MAVHIYCLVTALHTWICRRFCFSRCLLVRIPPLIWKQRSEEGATMSPLDFVQSSCGTPTCLWSNFCGFGLLAPELIHGGVFPTFMVDFVDSQHWEPVNRLRLGC